MATDGDRVAEVFEVFPMVSVAGNGMPIDFDVSDRLMNIIMYDVCMMF